MSDEGYYVPVGNGTEVAMLKFLQQNDYEVQDLMTIRNKNAVLET